jgi:hypothetical protein
MTASDDGRKDQDPEAGGTVRMREPHGEAAAAAVIAGVGGPHCTEMGFVAQRSVRGSISSDRDLIPSEAWDLAGDGSSHSP